MNRMKELRKELGINMKEAAQGLNMPYTTYVNYEKGVREPNSENLIAIANFFSTSIDYLLCKSDVRNFDTIALPESISPLPKTYSIPLLGAIACGDPILAAENLEGEVDVPDHIRADFALRCKGDSMINARIFDGDLVYIRQQDTVDDGDIAAVLIDDEATLKRVHFFEDHIVLVPENPMYRPFTYWGEEMNNIRILGKAVAFTSLIR